MDLWASFNGTFESTPLGGSGLDAGTAMRALLASLCGPRRRDHDASHAQAHGPAFDKGLICFDDKNILVVSKCLKDYLPNESLTMNFIAYEGNNLILPEKFLPDNSFLKYHREHIYRD